MFLRVRTINQWNGFSPEVVGLQEETRHPLVQIGKGSPAFEKGVEVEDLQSPCQPDIHRCK